MVGQYRASRDGSHLPSAHKDTTMNLRAVYGVVSVENRLFREKARMQVENDIITTPVLRKKVG